MLKRLLLAALAALPVLVLVLVVRTLQLPPPPAAPAAPPPIALDPEAAVQHLAAAIRVRTVSRTGEPPDAAAFAQLHALIEQSYPKLTAAMQREVIGAGALLYTWPGRDTALKPIVLMGHMDVVPVDEATLAQWTHAPFDGLVDGGYVWGRGAMDDKSDVFAILEAAEALIASGWQPQRTLIFAFGDDEEVGGADGATQIVARLKARGVQPEFVLDEGGAVTRGLVPGVRGDVALIGISEKGYASVRLRVKATGGHSSMPPKDTAIGILSRALAKLEQHPMPLQRTAVSSQMLDAIASQQPFGQRLALANRWLLDPLILQITAATPAGAATVRTTMAPTMLRAGIKDNVLPTEAEAVLNFRLLPGDTIEQVLSHVRSTIGDARVDVSPLDHAGNKEASPVSSTRGFGYTALSSTVRALFPDATVAPYLVVGATDSAHYAELTPDIYRFSAVVHDADDLSRMHGIDERMAVDSWLHEVQFIAALLRNSAGSSSPH